jgi:peptide/nickel transport system permease protein
VLWRHAVRNALLPSVTLVALSFAYVIGGAITVELVFSYPGVGLLTLQALEAQDYPLLQGMFLFFSAAVIIANLVADLLYSRLDPRVKEAW